MVQVPVPFLVSALSQMTNGPVVIVTAPVGGWALLDATWKVSSSLSSWPKAILGADSVSVVTVGGGAALAGPAISAPAVSVVPAMPARVAIAVRRFMVPFFLSDGGGVQVARVTVTGLP